MRGKAAITVPETAFVLGTRASVGATAGGIAMSYAVVAVAVLVVLLCTGIAADEPPGGPGKLQYQIDGRANDWKGITPVWEEAGKDGVRWKDGLDVKQVYLDNDDHHLYALLRLKPDLPEFFGRANDAAGSGSIGHFYFDTDADPATGSKRLSATAFGVFAGEEAGNDPKYAKYVGYDCELRINLGFTLKNVFSKERFELKKWIEYRAYKLDAKGGFNDEQKDCRATTEERGGPLAFDKDGLEMEIPLKCLGLKPGQTVRVLFLESGNWGLAEGLSYANLRLK